MSFLGLSQQDRADAELQEDQCEEKAETGVVMQRPSAGYQGMNHHDREDQQGVEQILQRFLGISQEAEESQDTRRRKDNSPPDPGALLEAVEETAFVSGAPGLSAAHAAGRKTPFFEKLKRGHENEGTEGL
jgi:hypothetical protein